MEQKEMLKSPSQSSQLRFSYSFNAINHTTNHTTNSYHSTNNPTFNKLSSSTISTISKNNVRIKTVGTKKEQYALNEAMLQWLTRTCFHRHIVTFYSYSYQPDQYTVTMESLPGPDLCDFTMDKDHLEEFEVKLYIAQIIAAIQYLHQNNVLHRDIKPENIVFADEFHTTVKLVDFDYSVFENSPEKDICQRLGTLAYMAPEVFQNFPYTDKADVWSLGVTIYVCASGKFPFGTSTNILSTSRAILNNRITYPEHFSLDLINLLKNIFISDPEQRFNINDVANHSFFK